LSIFMYLVSRALMPERAYVAELIENFSGCA
jgi:hypothetical protein